MLFLPPVVGCLLKKRLTKGAGGGGWVTGTPGLPGYAPAKLGLSKGASLKLRQAKIANENSMQRHKRWKARENMQLTARAWKVTRAKPRLILFSQLIRQANSTTSLRGVTLLITSGTLKISSMFYYRALIITETALATMALHYGTVYHAI